MIATASSVSSFARDVGDLGRGQRVDQVLADVIVHLGEDVAVEQVLQRAGEAGAILMRGQFEQVGDVGRVQRLDQRARFLVVARAHRVQHRIDEFGTQAIVLVQLVLFGGQHLGKLGIAHRCLRPCCNRVVVQSGASTALRHDWPPFGDLPFGRSDTTCCGNTIKDNTWPIPSPR